jgi:hypothetical protein
MTKQVRKQETTVRLYHSKKNIISSSSSSSNIVMSKSVDGGGRDFAVSGKRRGVNNNKKPGATTTSSTSTADRARALNDLFEKTRFEASASRGGGGGGADRTASTSTMTMTTTTKNPSRSHASPSRGGRGGGGRGGGAGGRGGSTSSSTASGGANDTNSSSNINNNRPKPNSSNNVNSNNNRPKKKTTTSSPAKNRPKDKLDSFLEKRSSQHKNEMLQVDLDDRSRGAYSTATHLRSKRSSRTRIGVKRLVLRNNSSGEDNHNGTLSTAVAALYSSSHSRSSTACSASADIASSPTDINISTTASSPATTTRGSSASGAIMALGRRLSAAGGEAAAGFGNMIHGGGHHHSAESSPSQNNATTTATTGAPSSHHDTARSPAGAATRQRGHSNLYDGSVGSTSNSAAAGSAATRRGSAGGAIVALGRRLSFSGGTAFGNMIHGPHGHGAESSSSSQNAAGGPSNLNDSHHCKATRRGSASETVALAAASLGRRMSAGGSAAAHAVTSTADAIEKNLASTADAIEKNLGSFLKLQKPRPKEDLETRSAYTTGGIDNRRHRHMRRTHTTTNVKPTPLPSTKGELIECLRSGTNNNTAIHKKKAAPPVVKLTNDPRKTAARALSPRAHRIKELDSLPSSSQPLRPPPTQQRKTARGMSPKAHRFEDIMNDVTGNGNTTSAARPNLQKQQSVRQPPPGRLRERSTSERKLRSRAGPTSNVTLTAKKDLVGGVTTNASSGEPSSSLQRPSNKHHGLAARGVTKSFDDAVLSPETERKKRVTGGGGGQNNGTSTRPRCGVRKPTITPEMLQNRQLTARGIQAVVENEARKMKTDIPSRPRTTSTLAVSKDKRNGDNARGGQPKPQPRPKQKPMNVKKGGGVEAAGPPKVPNRTPSQLQVTARRMHTTHVTMQSPKPPPTARGKIDIAADMATPKASHKHSVYVDTATPKVNNQTSARRHVHHIPEQGAADSQIRDHEGATPKIGNTSKRFPPGRSSGDASIPTLSGLNEHDDGDGDGDNHNTNNNNNNDETATPPPRSPHRCEVVRDFSPTGPVRRQPERLQEKEDEQPVAESSPEDVFSFYTWSKARQPVNKVQAERRVLKEIIWDGPLDSPYDIQTTNGKQSPRK